MKTTLVFSVLLTIATGLACGERQPDRHQQDSVRTVGDALAAVEANYKQIVDLSYDTLVSYSMNKRLQGSPAKFCLQQKGGYMSRQTDPKSGAVMILNASRTAQLDAQGKLQGGFEIDTVGNMQAGVLSTNGAPYYWDTRGFLRDFPGIATNLIERLSDGLVSFQAVPKDTTTVTKIVYTIDCERGVPVRELTQGPFGMTQQVVHETPVLIGRNIWLPTKETMTETYPGGVVVEWETKISNIKINQNLPDSLFAIPK